MTKPKQTEGTHIPGAYFVEIIPGASSIELIVARRNGKRFEADDMRRFELECVFAGSQGIRRCDYTDVESLKLHEEGRKKIGRDLTRREGSKYLLARLLVSDPQKFEQEIVRRGYFLEDSKVRYEAKEEKDKQTEKEPQGEK